MISNPVRTRRILLLASVLVVAVVGLLGLHKVRQHRIHLKCVAWRAEGLAAAKRGDFPNAVEQLQQYLHYHAADREALIEYIRVRPQVPAANGGHYGDTINAIRYLLGLEPGRIDARRQLLDLYMKVHYLTEARDVARHLIEYDGYHDDPAVQRNLCDALCGLSLWKDALPEAEVWTVVDPHDLDAFMRVLWVMQQMDAPKTDQVEKTEKWRTRAENLGDPRFELLKAIALATTGMTTDAAKSSDAKTADTKTASEWLESAQSRELLLQEGARLAAEMPNAAPVPTRLLSTPLDAQFVRVLIAFLDRLNLFDQSLDELQRFVQYSGDLQARYALARRQWERSAWPQALATSDPVAADPNCPDDVIAVRASAFHSLAQVDLTAAARLPFQYTAPSYWRDAYEAAHLVLWALRHEAELQTELARLQARSATDPVADAWLTILGRAVNPAAVPDRDVVAHCTAALEQKGEDAYLRYFLGDAYARLGETDLTITAWQSASDRNNTWYLPPARLADALVNRWRLSPAMQMVAEAWRRNPYPEYVHVLRARVWAATFEDAERADTDLLNYVTEVQRLDPGEEQTLIIQVVQLLRLARDQADGKDQAAATASRDRASKAVLDALDPSHPARRRDMSQAALLRLATISIVNQLHLEEQCLAKCQEAYGITPELTLAHAAAKLNAGDREGALTLFTEVPPRVNAITWRIAEARLLDLAQSPRALAAWQELAKANPNNEAVVRGLLLSSSAWRDARLTDAAIESLRALTGDKALLWQVSRARWFLMRSNQQRADLQQAADLLDKVVRTAPDFAEAHYLRARALQRLNDVSGALQEATTAATMNPSPTIALFRAQLLQAHGDFEQARDQLQRVSTKRFADGEQQRIAALLLAEYGNRDRAVQLLEESKEGSDDQLLLAMLYWRQKQNDKVETIVRKLLEQPTGPVVSFAADFYASQGRLNAAEAALDLLDEISLPDGSRELLLAQYRAKTNQVDAALELYRKATDAAPRNRATWAAKVEYLLLLGRADDAIASIDAAKVHGLEDAVLQRVRDQADLIRSAAPDASLRRLLIAAVVGAAEKNPSLQALSIILDARRRIADRSPLERRAIYRQMIVALRDGADHNLFTLPLQVVTAQQHAALGQWEDASAVATRAMRDFPADPEPARVANQMLLSAGHTSEALNAAREWRARATDDLFEAELALAAAALHAREYPDAVKALAPRVDHAKAHLDAPGSADVLAISACAMTMSGRSGEAKTLLQPLLPRDAKLRAAWVRLVIEEMDEAHASTGVDELEPILSAGDADDHIRLAQAWTRLDDRSGTPRHADRIQALLAALVDRPEPAPLALLAMGSSRENAGDKPGAEDMYRRALKVQPNLPLAQNNLAMLLLDTKPQESRSFAEGAVKALPIAAVYDTLARAQAACKDFDAAVGSMQMAAELETQNPQRQINLISLLLDAGRNDQAKKAMEELERLHPPEITRQPLRGQIEALRGRFAATARGSAGRGV
jgi:Tfp pilus assembly protein PilF